MAAELDNFPSGNLGLGLKIFRKSLQIGKIICRL
jgi:hypothetical protein